jgi:RHS repeat-associated protein
MKTNTTLYTLSCLFVYLFVCVYSVQGQGISLNGGSAQIFKIDGSPIPINAPQSSVPQFMAVRLYVDPTEASTGNAVILNNNNNWTYQLGYTITIIPSGDNVTGTLRLEDTKIMSATEVTSHKQIWSINQVHKDVLIPANTATTPLELIVSTIQNTANVGSYVYMAVEFYPATALPFAGSIDFNFNFNTSADNQSVRLSWDYAKSIGAYEYDLEWTYIDAFDMDFFEKLSNDPNGDKPDFPFHHKEPIRISTSNQFFELPITYPEGLLFFRVRGIGRNASGKRRVGDWNYGGTVGMRCEITNGTPTGDEAVSFESNRLWQAITTYAEEGKFKKVVSFYDGSMRNRQTLTNLNTENLTLIAETKYDYEGRGVLNILPVPMAGSNLSYQASLNPFEGTVPLSKDHFDHKDILREKLDVTNGASRYYSPENDLKITSVPNSSQAILMRDYIPDAQGYPYTQVEYMNDNTGRVSRQGGVGETFQLYGGRDTKFYYGNPAKGELQRLFGDNVGEAKRYQKNLSIDPNGQASVSYLDNAGKVIATALAGKVPDNLEAIPNKLQTIVVDLNDQDHYDPEKRAWITNHVLVSTALPAPLAIPYNFSYTVKCASLPCVGADCKYQLLISVVDPEGTEIWKVEDTIDKNIACDKAYSEKLDFKKSGNYTVYKELRLVSQVEDLLESAKAAVGDKQTFITNYTTDASRKAEYSAKYCPQNPDVAIDFNAPELDLILTNGAKAMCDALTNEGKTCEGQKCSDNLASKKFDLKLTLVRNWTQATNAFDGVPNADFYTKDPFFQTGGTIQTALQNALSDPNSGLEAQVTQFNNLPANQKQDVIENEFRWQVFRGIYARVKEVAYRAYLNTAPSCDVAPLPNFNSNSSAADLNSWLANNTSPESTASPSATSLADQWYATFEQAAIEEGCDLTSQKADIMAALTAYFQNWNASQNPTGLLLGAVYHPSTQAITDILMPLCPTLVAKYFTPQPTGTCDFPLNITTNNKVAERGYYLKPIFASSNPTNPDNKRGFILVGANPLGNLTPTTPFSIEFLFSHDRATTGSFAQTLLSYQYDNNNGTKRRFRVYVAPSRYLSIDYVNSFNEQQIWDATSNGTILNDKECYQVSLTRDGSEIRVYVNGALQGSPINNAKPDFAFNTSGNYITTDPPPNPQMNLPAANNDLWNGRWLVGDNDLTKGVFTGYVRHLKFWRGARTQAQIKDIYTTTCSPTPANLLVHFAWDNGTASSPPQTNPICLESGNPTSASILCYDPVISGSPAVVQNQTVLQQDLYCGTGTTTSLCLGQLSGYLPPIAATDPCEQIIEYILAQEAEKAYQDEVDKKLACFTDLLPDATGANLGKTGCFGNGFNEEFNYSYQANEYHYTLYYYDQAGNLVQTVPPKGVEIGNGNNHRMVTRYRYNSLNQPIWQNTPDAGTTEFFYDSKSRLRLSRNAKQAGNNDYSYTKHDAQGRTIEVGQLNTSTWASLNIKQKTTLLDDLAFPAEGSSDFEMTQITRTTYDKPKDETFHSQENDHLRGRVSAVTVLEDGEKEGARTFYQYDPHGNVKKLIQLLPKQATDPNSTPIIKTVDYVYDLISGKVNKVYYQKDNGLNPNEDQFVHRYDYDADNRLRTVYTSNDDWTWYKEATYLYYAHGPLARVELGEHTVQGLDYYYTLQGWLKGVNAPFDLTKDAGKDGYGTAGGVNRKYVSRDAFGFTLGYFDKDYTPIGAATDLGAAASSAWTGLKSNTATNKSAVGLYNGNIAWMATNLNTAKITHSGLQVMAYRYDQLNRIVSTQANVFNGAWAAPDRYKETFSYDPNGNITFLNRNGETGSPIDQLEYVYNSPDDNNRLGRVDDNSGSDEGLKKGTANYHYDAIGNLETDSEEGIITPIKWTVYGKVSKATKGATTIEYKYDGMGHRVVKKTNTKTTYYVRDASGNVMAIYEQLNAQTQINLTEQPIYGSSRIGIYHGQGAQRGATEMGVRQYEITNHLQNTLITISDNKIGVATNNANLADFYEARVLSATDYYAFGMSMKGRTWQSEKYRYGFNGKENDADWEVQDYGFRIYKPELGKFLSVDPLTQSYPWYTPYQFAGNKPIQFIDLDGLEEANPQHNRNDINLPTPFKVGKITTDAGHGVGAKYVDPGAVSGDKDEYLEKDFALLLEKSTNKWLKKMGLQTYRTRTGDVKGISSDESLRQRPRFANKFESDIFVSFHMESGSNEGLFIVYQQDKDNEESSINLAKSIIEQQNILPIRHSPPSIIAVNEGTRYQRLGVLNQFKGKAGVLIEAGLINSPSTRNLIKTRHDDIGYQIAKGIYLYFHKDARNLNWREKSKLSRSLDDRKQFYNLMKRILPWVAQF